MATEADDAVTDPQPFVPTLTVLVDYGNAPFLWCVDAPEEAGVGGNMCDGTGWDEGGLMSEGLWRKFADWAIEFDQTSFYLEDFDASGWDWMAFHEQGLQLTRWLEEEVGDAYRVVYHKPFEDPNHRIDERTEVLSDGTLLPLPPFRNHLRDRLASAGTLSQAGRPVQIGVRWILLSSTGRTRWLRTAWSRS